MKNLLNFLKKEETNKTDRQKIGSLGEELALKHLKKKRYKIVGTNVHAGKSELDIVATRGDTLVFVEVKTRVQKADREENLARPADAVNKEKSAYLVRGANRFAAENADRFGSFFKRIDIIEVYLTEKNGKITLTKIEHFENAL